ncbi:MAG: deoxyribodipyrimidine photo-lyase [Rickettsiales bacterium]|nr:deoxyribodipyrimidine photo-lyase [Rickettsiales bacterium]
MTKIIVWLRQDLRISDNPALYEAAKFGKVLPIFILDEAAAGEFKISGAAKVWLFYSLQNLNKSFAGKINFYQGNAKEILAKIIKENNIAAVYWNRCYEPWRIKQDSEIKTFLKSQEILVKSFNASLLFEPWQILKSDQTPYKVFTPFYRNGCLQGQEPRKPISKPSNLDLIKDQNSQDLENLNLLPTNNWYKKITDNWQIGENFAQEKLQNFLKNGLKNYKEGRNFPDKKNVSQLSPHLRFGEISPNQIWYEAQAYFHDQNLAKDVDHFLSELGWREFSYYLLYHFPTLPRQNFQKKFDKFPWSQNLDLFKAWKLGKTGFPIVDAGMRELWQTGYMHNRVRMIVGSFLVKNLLLHWHLGENWFWDCLVDADLANNSASWQWVAGSGADAAPYFRIFNPILQGEKFDPDGNYTRRFVPEIAKLPNKYLFKPWQAPIDILQQAKIELGKDYPKPIVDMESSRNAALNSYKQIS